MEELSGGLIDIPEDSVVDTESSDGQGHVFEELEYSDGDHEKDEDYVMDNASDESDKPYPEDDWESNVDVHQEQMKGKGKVSRFFHLLSHQCVIPLPEGTTKTTDSERRLPQRYQRCPRQFSNCRKYRH